MRRVYCDNCEAELGGDAPLRIDEVTVRLPREPKGWHTVYLQADLCSLDCAAEWFAQKKNDPVLAPVAAQKEVV
jgi:hypothetical protein